MKAVFFILTIFLGIILDVHLAMNSKVGADLNNTRVANALFWCVGAVAAVIIGAFGWHSEVVSDLKGINPILFIAGALGACLVFAIIWILPQVGARALFITLIAGQVLGGMALSQFGWLGSPVQRVTWVNAVGALVMLGGVVLATYSK